MKLASGFRRRPRIEEIEARILYSADVGLGLVDFAAPVPTAEHRTVDASGEFVQSDAKEGQTRRQEIVFVDTATPDYQALADDIRAHADVDRQVEVVLLDRDTDGIKQISDTLAGRQDVSAVHIIAHGSDAEVELGDSKLDFATLLKNATQIKQWGQALTSDADLLIYGCNVAQRTDGQALMDALARLTGADVNASEDVTGNRGFGGNWNLEYRTGSIETHLAISTMEQAGWRGTLAIGDAPPSADGGQTAQSTTASGDQAPNTPSQVTLAAVPLAFQPNVGQADDQSDFLARGNGYSVWLTGGDAVLDLRDGGNGNVVRLDVLGKNTGVAAQGENELQAKTNYLVGSQDQWHQDVANYSAVRYNDIYDGVDLRYYGNQQQLEYDFVVNPGANANNIQLKFEGVQSATVADNGDLVLDLGAGRSISFKAPVAYQDGADGREAVSSSYHIAPDGTIGFDLGAYDASRQLVIDPVLSYSTYLGGTNADVANGVTVDAAGNVYLVGYTTSLAFPTTPGAYNPNDPDLLLSDVFVTKFAPNLGSVLYSTYVGGTNNDYGTAVAVDAAGNAYVTGYTTSTLLNINNFPTVSAYQSTQGGTQDAFLFKLDPTGSTLIYSTYLGGSGSNDIGWAVAVDAAGSAYVTGGASSSDFPTTLGAVDTTYSGGDAFVTKFNTSGNALVYSTFIGGSSTEIGYSIAVDGGGNAVVVGETSSNNLPTTANAYQTSWGKKTDAFVSKLNAAGSAFMYSTYLGGDNDDYAYAVAIDSAGKIYLTGETAANYPITAGAFQTNHKSTDAFVSILNPSLSGSASLVYSSYLGGGGTEAGLGIGVDASGRVFVAGQTNSSDFPVTAGAYQTARSGGVDAFMVAIDPLGTGSGDLAYGSYFGGAGDDYGDNAVYSNGRFYLAGDTTSVSGIATVGSFDTNYNLGTDAFAAVFTVDRAPVLTVTTTALSYIEDAGAIPVDANLTLSDPDSVSLTGATVQITANYLSSEDVLAFNNTNSWGITGTWSASTGKLSLVGSSSAANYQAALRSITYQNTSQKPSTATRTVSFVADDGIYSSTAVTRQISVASVNDAPLNTIPGPQNIDEDTALVFSSVSGNPISIVDVDAGNSPIQVTLSASSGKLTLSQITGLTFITGTGSGNQTMTFTGNVANVNAALNGLRFDPTPDFNGTASLQVVTNDQGNTGTGGSLGGASTIVINVAAVNDAPSYSLPGPQSTQQNNALVFSSSTGNAISVADVDAGAGTLSMTLIANQGTLTLGSLLGLASVAGNGSGTVALSGTLAALNGAVNGLLFTPASGYSGPASLQIITNDQGNTGSGLSAVVSGVIAISVSPNVAPLITTSASALTYTEDSLPTAIDSSLTVVDADTPLLDHAVVRVAANYAQGEDVLGFTNQLGITGVWNAATGTLLLTGSASAADYQTALRSVTYQDLSEDPSGGSLVVSFAVNDGIADGAIATRAINVIAVNDAPMLTTPAIQTIDEDTSLVFSAGNGNAISIVDVDAGSAQIQVTLAAANGVLSLAQTTGLTFTAGADGAASMTFTGTVSGINAALNGLNFKPGSDYDGAASITVVANDLGNGGTGGAKSATASIGINITGVNDAPSGVDSAVTILEDTVYTFTSGDFGFTDSNDSPANNLLALTVTSIPAAGTLTLSGTTVTAGQSISASDIAAGKFEFSPVAQANGSAYCSFGFQVQDDGGTANGGVDLDPTVRSMTVNVIAINDAPQGTDHTVLTAENTAYTFGALDFGFTDPDDAPANALAAVRINSLPGAGSLTLSGVAVTSGQTILLSNISAGNLQFTPAADANGAGYAAFTFQVQDNGGTANSGVDLDVTPRSMTIDVTSVNDAPIGTNNTVTTNEDSAYTFGVVDFGFTDPNDIPANSLLAVTITTLPTAGQLTNNGIAVTAGQSITLADITGGQLVFAPAADANGAGYAAFTFQVQDDGGTVSGGVDLDVTPRTMTVNVTAVNDVPIGTNNTVTTNEDTAYTFGVADFGFTDPNDIPANSLSAVMISSLPGAGSLTLSGVAVTSGQNISVANITAGNLKFTPAADANGAGYAAFTFQVQDDGGTSSGGVDTDATPNTMTINVTAVNDAPSAANLSAAESYTEDTLLNLTDIVVSDVDSANVTAILTVSNVAAGSLTTATSGAVTSTYNAGTGVWTASGALADVNTLLAGVSFTPALDFNSNFTITTSVSDGVAAPITGSKAMTGTPVNDAPQAADNSVSTLENTGYIFGVADFGLTDPKDSPSDALLAVRINSLPGAGALMDNGVAVTTGQFVSAADIAANLLVFTPTPGTNGVGYANFSFQVQDDGGTANGGVDLDPASHTMTLNVFSVNDAPVGTNNTVTTNEDTAYTFGVADFGFTDPNDIPANSLSAVMISSLPGAGSLTLSGVAVTSGQTISLANISAGNLQFTPLADANGAGYAAFTFQVQDNGGAANGGVDLDVTPRTMTVNVTAVNDAPSATNLSAAESYTEDTPLLNLTDIVVSDVDSANVTAILTLSNVAAGSLTTATSGAVTSTYNALTGVWTASGALADVNALLAGVSFTPALDFNSNFTITTSVSDGVAAPVTGSKAMTATPVNDAPVGTNNTVTTNEDSAYTFGVVDFGFSDPNDIPANSLLAVTITTLPTAGQLTNNGIAVTAGQSITLADITGGQLVFAPAADANGAGYAAFTFQVQDNGGTANGGVNLDVTPRTMTVDVTTVNDAPTATNLSAAESYAEDTPLLNLTDIVVSDVDSANVTAILTLSNVAAGSLTTATSGAVTSTYNALTGVWTASGALADVNTLLAGVSFTPALDFNSNFTITTSVSDGVAAPITGSKAMTGTPVNDPPVVVQNTGISLATGGSVVFSSSILGVTDPDNTPAQLLYKLTAQPGAGSVRLGGVALALGGTFTQADINSGQVSYVHTGTTSISTTASFTVTDGSGGSIGPVTLGINVTSPPVVVPPIVVTPPPAPPPAPTPPPSGGGSGPGSSPAPAPAPAPAPSPSGGTSGPSSPAPTGSTDSEEEAAAAAQAIQAAGTSNLSIISNSANTNTRAPQISLAVLLVQDPRLSGTPGIRGGSDGPSTIGGEAVSPIAQTETLNIGFASSSSMQQAAVPALSAFKTTLNRTEWVGDLDKMRESIEGHANTEHRIVGQTAMVTGGLSVGYVIWLLRGGLLLTSLLSSLPAWNVVDPLPILANAKRSDEENEEDVDPLEKLFGRARAAIRGTRAQDEHEVEEAQADSATPTFVEDKPAQPEGATA